MYMYMIVHVQVVGIAQNRNMVQNSTCEKTEFFFGTERLVRSPPLLVGREQLISDVIESRPLVTIILGNTGACIHHEYKHGNVYTL